MSPPSIAESLLRRLLAGASADVESVVGDLREEYAERPGSRLRARAWYWAQVLSLPIALRWHRRRSLRADAERTPRSTRGGGGMGTELRQTVRFLTRRPGFSGAIILTVALAIAATTLAFAAVDGVLLEPFPYRNPDRIVVLWEHNIPRERPENVVSPVNFLTWRESVTSFSDIASAVTFGGTITSDGDAERVGGVQASPSLFSILGATPLIGRLYDEEDDRAGADRVVVLSESYWMRRFGGDPAVIGRDLVMGDESRRVIGVLPERFDVPIAAEFDGTGTHDVWVPPAFPAAARTEWRGRYLQVFAALRPGVTVESARAEMGALAAQLRADYPDRQAGWDVTVKPLREQITGDIRVTLLVIFGAVSFVLLIACGNVANLLLTRATARQQEMAVRSALGAGRGRLVRQLLLESALLSAIGGALGVLLAFGALRALLSAAPAIPRIEVIGLDASVLAFAFGATLLTALLFGLAPALQMARGDAGSWLRDRGGAGGRRDTHRLRNALVVTQVALSLVLLVGAGLLLRSFANRLALGVGFDVEQLLVADVQLPDDYDDAARPRFFEELVQRVATLPGITSASAITFAPLSGTGSGTSIWPLDRPAPAAGEAPTADIRWVHADYQDVLGIPLVDGRFFDGGDHASAPLRIVINETAARTFWPNGSAVGGRIAMSWGDTLQAEVIGVVGDVRIDGPETVLRPMLYWDHRQLPVFQQMTVLARTTGDPLDAAAAVRRIVSGMDARLPLYNVTTMRALHDDVLARPRFATMSFGAFAALGLLLAGIGIYSVIAFVTQQRNREIGIRVALGADRRKVVRLVLSQALVLVAIAIGIGLAGAVALTRLLQGLIFDVSATDPATFAGTVTLLAAVALIAAWLPARRAGRVDPVEAIRGD